MQPADLATSRRMDISWYAAKWRRLALTQISLRQMRGQSTSQTSGEERFDEKKEDTENFEDLEHPPFPVHHCLDPHNPPLDKILDTALPPPNLLLN
ncbi:hypothetical protein M8J77_013533 [Diaphorina citri]|nr:hypothetical protein M8J77_013533 [Diaphorina citri]